MKLYPFLLIFIIFLNSCSDDLAKPGNNDLKLAGENFNFYKSQELFNNVNLNRSTDITNKFEIISVERTGKQLDITVSYYGECEVNTFDLIWDGHVMESYPCQVRIAIKRTSANCKSLTILKTETISVDLVKIFGSSLALEPLMIHFVNNSTTIDTEDGDNSVSTEP